MMGYDGFGGMGWGGMVGMLLLWAVLIVVVVWAVTRLLPARRDGGIAQAGQETPEEILDRRFARGEIVVETYHAQRAALASARGERR